MRAFENRVKQPPEPRSGPDEELTLKLWTLSYTEGLFRQGIGPRKITPTGKVPFAILKIINICQRHIKQLRGLGLRSG